MKVFLRNNGLSLALAALFSLFLTGQAVSGWLNYNEEQSEFLAIFTIVVLSIWLREKGSPESKPVAAAHSETGR